MKKTNYLKWIGTLGLSSALWFGVQQAGVEASTYDSVEFATESKITNSLRNYLDFKIDNNVIDFKSYQYGKVIELVDLESSGEKYYVSIVDDNKQTLGYAIIDADDNFDVIEFSLGDTEPVIDNIKTTYYLGSLSLAQETTKGELKSLSSKEKFNRAEAETFLQSQEKKVS